MRVLFVCSLFPRSTDDFDGVAQLHRAQALADAQDEVQVLVLKSWRPGYRRHWHPPVGDSIAVQLGQHPSLPRLRFAEISLLFLRLFSAFHFRRAVRSFRPDLVHIHTERVALALSLDRRPLDIPVLVSLHAADRTPRVVRVHSRRGRLVRAFANADSIMLVGDVLREHFSAFFGATPVVTVHNGFQLENGPKRPRSAEGGATRLISISRLFEGKGVQYALQALAELPTNAPWSYEIVGSGPFEKDLRDLSAALGVQDRVVFTGALSHSEAMERLAHADMFVLPSFFEAFGVAHLEAMASGCLTIGVEGQGPSEFIEHGKTGFLVPAHDAESITRIIDWAMNDWAGARAVALAGQRLALEERTWAEHAVRLQTLYAATIERRRARI